jgi:hypothetical protein
MILCLLAFLVMGTLGVVGYYQGAIRMACSLVGLLIAAPLAVPLSGVVKLVLRLIGVDHPVSLAIIAPIIVFALLMAGVKAGAQVLHKRVDTYFRYKKSDTEQLLFDRLQQRAGVAVAMANGFVYVIILSVILHTWGYFTFQLYPTNCGFTAKAVNVLAKDIQSTKMLKAISPFAPAAEKYYQAVDILGDIYHNPSLTVRLANYPAFFGLAEGSDFTELGKDKDFQDHWSKTNPRPRLRSFRSDERLEKLIESTAFYTNVLGLLNNDMTDLRTCLETGKSPKYDDQVFLGTWYFDYASTLKRARKPNMTLAEKTKLVQELKTWTNSVVKIFVDNRFSWKNAGKGGSSGDTQTGAWKEETPTSFVFTVAGGKKDSEVAAAIEESRLLLNRNGYTLYFEH